MSPTQKTTLRRRQSDGTPPLVVTVDRRQRPKRSDPVARTVYSVTLTSSRPDSDPP